MKGGCGLGVEFVRMRTVGLGRFRRRGWTVLVATVVGLVLGVGACGGGGDGGSGADRPGATVPDDEGASAGGSTTSTAGGSAGDVPIDITTKPSVVTVAYADAVMDELDRVLSEAIREFVAADGPTKSFDDKLNAVYDEPSLENARQAYGKFAVDGASEFRHPPGDVSTKVEEILKVDDGCVVLKVARTFASTLVDPKPNTEPFSYIAWEPTDEGGDPASANRTPWSVVFDGNVLEGEEPRNAC
jgi:hypothetical protein